jgi:hypothetical protein
MPFTFSHPAIVLPLNYLPKRWISLTALVIGSMTPDFEYFIRMKVSSQYSHTWTGLFWFDLPLALLLMAIYNIIVKNKLIDHLPAFLNKRFSKFKKSPPFSFKYIGIIIICILIGTASHIFWDSFTHPSGYFVNHSPLLSHHVIISHYSIPFYKIMQQVSTLTGAIIILYAVLQLPAGQLTKENNIIYYWTKVFGIALLVLIIGLFTGLKFDEYGDVIVTGISGILIGLIITSLFSPMKWVA